MRQYLSMVAPEAFEPDEDVPWDEFLADDIPRLETDVTRSGTVPAKSARPPPSPAAEGTAVRRRGA